MTYGRILHMYGDKPALSCFSLVVFFFALGWRVADPECSISSGHLFGDAIILLLGVQIMDALIKTVVFFREHFSVSISVTQSN